jgi:hypothetical protein
VITLIRRDRLGNVLSQYSFARVLAERFGYRLTTVPVPNFSGTLSQVCGEEILSPLARWQGQWPFDSLISRPVQSAELLVAGGAHLILTGWFQRFELIADARQAIREDWLRLDNPWPIRPSGDFAICLRLGDYARGGIADQADEKTDTLAHSVLREDEVRRLVKVVPHKRLYIVTDQPDHPMIEALRDIRAEIRSGEMMDDFRFIHSCQKVAISQSTFHWWATFLGRAREIYFPSTDRGIWSKPEPALNGSDPLHYGINLQVDEPQYIYDWI